MAAKLSNLVDKTSEANLLMDGQAEVPNQGVKDLRETEEEDSSPSLLLMWSPAWRPPSGHPDMKYFGRYE